MSHVVGLRTLHVRVPLHTPFTTALRTTSTAESLVVELVDSDGARGYGEAPQTWRVTGDSLAGARACLEGPLRDVLVGAPLDPWAIAPRISAAVVGNTSAKAAADVALHDLAARRAGRPLADHLAGQAEGRATPRRLPTDVTVAAGEVDALVDTALARVAEGFGVLKLKVGTGGLADVERVCAVRQAVGPDVVLRLDANQGWDARTAVEVVRALEDAGTAVELVEQPTPADDLEALAYVTRHVETPVMADESVFGLRQLVEVIRADAADMVNVKLAKAGGLTPALELLDVAARHGLGTMVGSMMETHVGVGAVAALAAARGTSVVSDLDAAWWLAGSACAGGVAYDAGDVVQPDRPGLGIDAVEEGPWR